MTERTDAIMAHLCYQRNQALDDAALVRGELAAANVRIAELEGQLNAATRPAVEVQDATNN